MIRVEMESGFLREAYHKPELHMAMFFSTEGFNAKMVWCTGNVAHWKSVYNGSSVF